MATAKSFHEFNTPSPPNKQYRPEIDGLRAFAVVVVIINHFNKDLLPSGYLGVDIFFVISGYVITSSLAGRESQNILDFVAAFYERRIKRLLPALVVCVLINSVLIALFNPDPKFALDLGWRSLFGISNITLYLASTDYFAQSAELNPFTHTWSLGVEEQFYVLFPFLIWFSGFGQQTAKGARNLFFWIGALTVASMTSFIYLYQVNQPAAYFLMPPRFWEMAAGCMLFIGLQKWAKIEQALEKVPPLLVVAAMAGVMFLPIAAAVPATLGIVALSAVLIANLKKGTAAYRLFTLRKVVYTGLISYSLYLWHWTVLCISRWTVGIHWWTVPIQIGLMVLISIGSYRHIERIFRNGTKEANRWTILLGGLATAIATLLISKIIALQQKNIYQLANPQVRWFEKKFPGGKVYRTWVLRESKSPATIPDTNETLTPRSCKTIGFVKRKDLHECLGAGARATNEGGSIYIIGDSHANAYAPGIRNAFRNRRVRTYTVGWRCSYLPYYKAIENGNSSDFNCLDYVKNIDFFVANYLGPNDMIVLGMDWRDSGGKKGTSGLANAIVSLASRVTSKGASFVLLDDVPQLGEPLVCQKTWYRPFPPTECIKSLEQVKRDQSSLDKIGDSINALNERSKYVSLRSDLCDKDGWCSIYLDGIQIFRDNGHITEDAAVRYTTKKFKRELSSLLF